VDIPQKGLAFRHSPARLPATPKTRKTARIASRRFCCLLTAFSLAVLSLTVSSLTAFPLTAKS
jgi:hypothetical protein